MSATPPSALQGTHAPSPFEVLWDRYRSLILTVVGAILLALVGNYAWKYFDQQETNEEWSSFAATVGMKDVYVDQKHAADSLIECLEDVDFASLEQAFSRADDGQKPYLLLAIARKAIMDRNWDRATKALDQLESQYPKHSLVVRSEMPVQSREQEEPEKDQKPAQQEKPKWKPAVAGSAVGFMREQIAAAKDFQVPETFAKPVIPEDAPRVRFTMGDYGSFVIALMPQAPLHREQFLKLAAESYWVDIAVDEIKRGTESFEQPKSLHLGFASTKDGDRTKWDSTTPSEHLVDFEETGLSHFAGAVAANAEAEGKSCADRFWICVDDAPANDGERVVFAYVVEGLDVLRSICEATMSAQEEERGQGRPEQNIRVTAVEVL